MASSNEDPDLGGKVGTFLGGLIFTAVVIFIILMCMEAVRVYRAHGFRPGKGRRALWCALAGFLGTVALSGGLAALGLALVAPWPASLGFLAFVITIELVDLVVDPPPPPSDERDLFDTLGPWRLHGPEEDQAA